MTRNAGWMVASLLLGLCAVNAYVRSDHDGVAYALGAAIGNVIALVMFSALVTWLIVKLRKSGRVLTPWMLIGAGVLGLVLIPVRVQSEREESAAAIHATTQRGDHAALRTAMPARADRGSPARRDGRR